MADNKTIADIIAWMKELSAMKRDAVFNAPVCYSCETTIAEADLLDELIPRLEAANNRECGDSAKLREALKRLDELLYIGADGEIHGAQGKASEIERIIKDALAATTTDEKSSAFGDSAKLREALMYLFNLIDMRKLVLDCDETEEIYAVQVMLDECRAALAAPPRNCDLYKTKEKAQEAFLKEPCDHPCGNCWVEDINNECGVDWLFATATEKKGENDGNK